MEEVLEIKNNLRALNFVELYNNNKIMDSPLKITEMDEYENHHFLSLSSKVAPNSSYIITTDLEKYKDFYIAVTLREDSVETSTSDSFLMSVLFTSIELKDKRISIVIRNGQDIHNFCFDVNSYKIMSPNTFYKENVKISSSLITFSSYNLKIYPIKIKISRPLSFKDRPNSIFYKCPIDSDILIKDTTRKMIGASSTRTYSIPKSNDMVSGEATINNPNQEIEKLSAQLKVADKNEQMMKTIITYKELENKSLLHENELLVEENRILLAQNSDFKFQVNAYKLVYGGIKNVKSNAPGNQMGKDMIEDEYEPTSVRINTQKLSEIPSSSKQLLINVSDSGFKTALNKNF